MLHTRAHLGWLAGRLPRFLGLSILNGVLSFGALICSIAIIGATWDSAPNPSLITVAFVVWVLAFPSGYAMLLIARWLRTHYLITDRRVFYAQGIISRDSHSIPLPQITNLAYRQDALDRMLGSGDLLIESGGRESAIVLHRLPHIKKTHSELLTLLPRQLAQPSS